MIYKDAILLLANSLLGNFDVVYHSAEIVTTDSNERFPAITQDDEFVSLVPTDQRETLYIRRNGDDLVMQEARLASCAKAYAMMTPLRIVYFKDHSNEIDVALQKLMQSSLIGHTKLLKIIRDKWKLLKDESTGDYKFGGTTAYFAIDVHLLWTLQPDNCDEDFCVPLDNPLKKEQCPVVV